MSKDSSFIKRLPPREYRKDLAYRSLETLEQKCTDWFKKKFKKERSSLYFADIDSFTDLTKVSDIILFGSAFKKTLQLSNKKIETLRIWVLSKRTKELLLHFFSFSEDQIGIIPRAELFEINNTSPLNLENLVYAGRLSSTKNISFLIRVFNEVQKKIPNAQLTLIGPSDNQIDPYHGHCQHGDYSLFIKALINELDWQKPPLFLAEAEKNEWIEKIKDSSFSFFSLSKYSFEDFGVALAQAHQKGAASLCSDWGGHSFYSPSHFLIDSSLIMTDLAPIGIQKSMAKRVCDSIIQRETYLAGQSKVFIDPVVIDRNSFNKAISLFASKSPEVDLLMKDKDESFFDTKKGREVALRHQLIYQGLCKEERNYLIYTDRLESIQDSTYQDWLEKEIKTSNLVPISLESLFSPFFIHQSRKSISFYYPKKLDPKGLLLRKIKYIFGEGTPCHSLDIN